MRFSDKLLNKVGPLSKYEKKKSDLNFFRCKSYVPCMISRNFVTKKVYYCYCLYISNFGVG